MARPDPQTVFRWSGGGRPPERRDPKAVDEPRTNTRKAIEDYHERRRLRGELSDCGNDWRD